MTPASALLVRQHQAEHDPAGAVGACGGCGNLLTHLR
jgi:hypothetical protein